MKLLSFVSDQDASNSVVLVVERVSTLQINLLPQPDAHHESNEQRKIR